MGFARVNQVTGQVVESEANHWERQWLDTTRVIDHDGTVTLIDNVTTGQPAYNTLAAGGGSWWGFRPGGVYRSDGTVLDTLGGDPYADWDGHLVYVRPFNADWREIVREDGTVVVPRRKFLKEARISGELITWQDVDGTWARVGGAIRRVPPLGEQTFRPIPFWRDGVPWVLETTHTGFVLRPIDSLIGFRFDNDGHAYNPDVFVDGAAVTVWYTLEAGGGLRSQTFVGDGAELAPIPIPPEPPIEPPIEPPVEPPVEPPIEPPVEPPVTPPVTPPTMTTVTLRCHDGVHYVCAELDGSMNATRTAAGPWETFGVVAGELPHTNGLQSHHGKFVCAEEGGGGIVVANRDRVGPWESFKLHLHTPSGLSLETHTGHFVCAEEGGGGIVNATRLAAGPWETFNTYPPSQPGPGPGPSPGPGPGFQGALRKDGRLLRTESGARFLWRGATSFRLLHMVATGEEAAAVERMKQLSGMGFNLVRVLATARHLFQLEAGLGRAHLRRLFDLAREASLYVEIVPFADTDEWSRGDLEAHLGEVYARACEVENVLVEGGNELGPCHETQAEEAVDVARAFVTGGPALYCPGSVHGGGICNEREALTEEQWEHGQATGEWPYWDEVHTYSYDFGTSHLKRDGSDADRGRRVRELEESSNQADCLFVDDEPLGADETTQPGRRSAEPGVFYLQGVLGRVMETGSTFHSQAGLTSAPFGPVQQGCAEGFINGSRIVADDVRLTFKNTGWSDSPVKSFSGAVRVYSGLGADNIACVIGPEPGFWMETQNGYRDGGIRADVTGCRVISLVR